MKFQVNSYATGRCAEKKDEKSESNALKTEQDRKDGGIKLFFTLDDVFFLVILGVVEKKTEKFWIATYT